MGISRFEPRNALPVALLIMAELAPTARPLTLIEPPGWVEVVRTSETDGAVFDPSSPPRWAMAWQTIHGRPISGGTVARTPYLALSMNERRLNRLRVDCRDAVPPGWRTPFQDAAHDLPAQVRECDVLLLELIEERQREVRGGIARHAA